jgi:hypothetical protein
MSPAQMHEVFKPATDEPSSGLRTRLVHALSDDGGVEHFGQLYSADEPSVAYGEEAFHYFLEIERKRSEVSNRPFLLMLLDWRSRQEADSHIDHVTARKLFSVLSRSVRDTDFLGWYREGRVAGAVLTQHGEAEGDDYSEAIRSRVSAEFAKQFDGAFQVRVFQVSPTPKSRSES